MTYLVVGFNQHGATKKTKIIKGVMNYKLWIVSYEL